MFEHGSKYFIDLDEKEQFQLYSWDTSEKLNLDVHPPPCPKCGKNFIKNDDDTGGWIDPCLGKLPGVKAACCGHGVENGYVYFENGPTIYFDLKEIY